MSDVVSPSRRSARRVGNELRAGRRGVAVLHDDQHAVVAVEHRRRRRPTAGRCARSRRRPSPDGALLHDRRHRAGGGERHAEAEDRIALVERREGRERMAADVARDMDLARSPVRSSFMAENTGRSGQPMQNVGGRSGSGAPRVLCDLGAPAWPPRSALERTGDIDVVGGAGRRTPAAPRSPPRRCTRPPSAARPCRRSSSAGRALRRDLADRLLDVSRAHPPRRPARPSCRRRSRRSGRAPADG